MKIAILALGSRGDVQPFVALGLHLRDLGHSVRLVVYADCSEMVQSHGLEAFRLNVAVRPLLEGNLAQAWLASGRNFLSFLRYLRQLAEPLIRGVLDDSWTACRDVDAIVYTNLGFAGWHIAERLGVPVVAGLLQPYARTRSFPNLMISSSRRLGGTLNLLTYVAGEQMLWQIVRTLVNRWRRETLGIPALPLSGPFARVLSDRVPHVFGYSPAVVPKPPDWPDWYHVTGYWFLEDSDAWQPPAELEAFLEAGPAPVYVGLGSMRPRDPVAFTKMVVDALGRVGRRGVLQVGWGGLGQTDLSRDIIVVREIPHDWLFPRVAAVVHHGGAGTTGAGLRAGLPTVVLPFFADQPFWGQRVAELGAGPRPIPQKRLSAAALAGAIDRATSDPRMRARAAQLSDAIRSEGGATLAAAIVDRHFRTNGLDSSRLL